jgi:hypothetical protein
MSWHVPSIVTLDEDDQQNGPGLRFISQITSENPPYSICGHSMDQNPIWNINSGELQQCDMFIYGGWEWKKVNGKVEGPSLSQSLRILRAKDASKSYESKLTWGRLEILNHDQLGPGQRANHSSAAHKVGLFIFGGRCFDTSNKNVPPPSKNMIRHGSNTSVQLKYLNDLCILRRVSVGEGELDEADTAGDAQWIYQWAKVEVSGAPPRPRENAQMINVNDGSLLLHGGYSGAAGHCPPLDEYVGGLPPGTVDHPWLDDLYVLRVIQNNDSGVQVTWTQVLTGSKSPSPRCGHGLILADVADTDPSKCIFTGDGLKKCVVGGQANFLIKTHDKNGNPRWSGRDTFRIIIEGPWPTRSVYKVDEDPEIDEDGDMSLLPSTGNEIPRPTEQILARIEDLSNGKYIAYYTAMVSGHYTINVMCNGETVNDVPFSMWAQAGPATPTNSRVTEIDGEKLETNVDSPQFILTAGERSTISVTTRDHFGNLRKRGGEAWRLKVHVLSLLEDIDGGSKNMLKWRHATPLTTYEISDVARELYVNSVRQAAIDISSCIVIRNDGMELEGKEDISYKSYSGKQARTILKDYVSRNIRSDVPDAGPLTSDPATTMKAEEIVHRVRQKGILLGGEYYVLSSTMKFKSITSGKTDNNSSTDFFQHWSLLFHAVNPEGGAEHALLIEDAAAFILLHQLNSDAIAGFREYSFDEGTKHQEQYTCVIDSPAVAGPALLAVTMDGRHIIGSPFKCNLRPSVPSSKHTVVKCGNNKDSATNMEQIEALTSDFISLTITSFDKNGLPRDIGGSWYTASAQRLTNSSPGQQERINFVVADHGDGTYSSSMSFPTVGVWKIDVKCYMFPPELRGDGGGNQSQLCTNGNVMRVKVNPSHVCASQCIIRGLQSSRVAWSLLPSGNQAALIGTKIAPHRVVAGDEIILNLTARDAFGNRVDKRCNFSMRLLRQGGHEVLGFVEKLPSSKSNGDSDAPTHRCRATLYESALYDLRVTEGFDFLPSMPTAVLVEPQRPHPLSCVITSNVDNITEVRRHLTVGDIAELFLIAKDKYGNVCDLTIDDISARIVWPH